MSRTKDKEQEMENVADSTENLMLGLFRSSDVLASSIISATSVKLTPRSLEQCMRWMVGGVGSSLDGRVEVSRVKAGRVHPFPSIGQAGNEPAPLKP